MTLYISQECCIDKRLSARIDGQPLIFSENDNNTLDYWSVDYAGNEELPHNTLTGIKLDKTPPQIGIPAHEPPGDVTPYGEVDVSTNVTDSLSFVKDVRLEYTTNRTTIWFESPMTLNSTTGLYQATILCREPDTQVKYRILASDNAGNNETEDNAGQFYVFAIVTPEMPSIIILPLFITAALVAVIFYRRKHNAGFRQENQLADRSQNK
jgi:hypothetical protein